MSKNIGNPERVVRAVIGVVLIGATLADVLPVWGWIGVVPLATAAVSFCPLWRIFGVNTCKTGM